MQFTFEFDDFPFLRPYFYEICYWLPGDKSRAELNVDGESLLVDFNNDTMTIRCHKETDPISLVEFGVHRLASVISPLVCREIVYS